MSHENPFDIQQDQALADKDEKSKLLARRVVDDLKWIMSDKRGRRFVARLLDQAGLHLPSIDANTASMAFKEGKRWFGTLLMEEIKKTCFDRYIEMLQEQRNDH